MKDLEGDIEDRGGRFAAVHGGLLLDRARARGVRDRLGQNARNAGIELGGGVRVDLRGRGGEDDDGKVGIESRGRKEEGGGGHRSLAGGWFFGQKSFGSFETAETAAEVPSFETAETAAPLAVCYLIVAHHNLTLQCRSGRKTTSPPKTQGRSSRGGHPEGREGRPHGDQWTLSVKSEIHTPPFRPNPDLKIDLEVDPDFNLDLRFPSAQCRSRTLEVSGLSVSVRDT